MVTLYSKYSDLMKNSSALYHPRPRTQRRCAKSCALWPFIGGRCWSVTPLARTCSRLTPHTLKCAPSDDVGRRR